MENHTGPFENHRTPFENHRGTIGNHWRSRGGTLATHWETMGDHSESMWQSSLQSGQQGYFLSQGPYIPSLDPWGLGSLPCQGVLASSSGKGRERPGVDCSSVGCFIPFSKARAVPLLLQIHGLCHCSQLHLLLLLHFFHQSMSSTSSNIMNIPIIIWVAYVIFLFNLGIKVPLINCLAVSTVKKFSFASPHSSKKSVLCHFPRPSSKNP